MNLLEQLRNRKIVVDILSIVFGCGSWIAVNGMWVELPIMVQRLPESWNLAAYLSVIIQLANIGPILYSLSYKLCKQFVNNTYIIHVMMTIGVIACFLLGFFWDHTATVGNSKHSVTLFVMLFFLALVDCSSSVLFFPFMALYNKKYLTSFLIGESLSGFIPSIVSLGQGAGSSKCRNVSQLNTTTNETTYSVKQVHLPPRFSVEVFFFFLSGMMIASWTAFMFLRYHSCAKSEQVKTQDTGLDVDMPNVEEVGHSNSDQDSSSTHLASKPSDITFKIYVLLLLLQAWLCFLSNGFLPTVQTYSALPYGTTAYHLAITLSSIASPSVCVLALFITLPKVKGVIYLAITGSLLTIYLIVTASTSPFPPLQGTIIGQILIVLFWVLVSGIFSFAKVCIANTLRDKGQDALFMYGVATQAGSGVGAVITFILTAVAKVFKSYHPC